MYISTNGIIVNEHNHILLVRRRDSRTLAPPGGGLDHGELPPSGTVREIYEETGIIAQANQLAALFYWPNEPYPFLTFSFLCTATGGQLRDSNETRDVAYYPTRPLPIDVLPFHRKRIETGMAFTAGRPDWYVQQMNLVEDLGKRFLGRIFYPLKRLRHRIQNRPITPGKTINYDVGAFTIIQNELGEVLWVKRTDFDGWNLPGGRGKITESPWDTAVRETLEETGTHVRLTKLSGVYFYHDKQHVIFVFTAVIESGQLTTGAKSADFAYFAPGNKPENTIHQHIERATDAFIEHPNTIFRFQSSKTL
ncbi:MAG: NUDIX domain-containing protein, partial [Chloroflexi bacterium]|nr:NUDIX domain-containing protein [Chloroflexota bacterium]